jgi:hypothetical protein
MNDIKSWPPGLTVVEVLIFDTSQFPVYYLAIFSRTDRGWSIIPGNGIRTSFPLNTRIVTLGTRDRILPILGNQFQSATKRVKELIGIEEAAHPDAVGEPISVIEFSRNGPQWLQAGACK